MNYTPSDHRLLDAIQRNDFVAFTQRVFSELHPGKQMIVGWHHEAVAYILEVTAMTGEHDRAMINLLPRSLKSVMVSVALPPFCWAVIQRARSSW